MSKRVDPNVKHDDRHLSARSVSTPDAEGSISFVRCENCHRLTSPYEIQLYGKCPDCANRRFRGATVKKFPSFEWLGVQTRNVLYHWTVHGPKGWGYNRAKEKEQKKRGKP